MPLKKSMLNRLYTIGYQTTTPTKLVELVKQSDAFIADIRFSPRSSKPEWDLGNLQQFFAANGLPNRLVHVPELGNVNYKSRTSARARTVGLGAGAVGRGGIELSNESAGLERIANGLQKKPVIIMCACWDLRVCHRLVVAELAQAKLGVEIVWHFT